MVTFVASVSKQEGFLCISLAKTHVLGDDNEPRRRNDTSVTRKLIECKHEIVKVCNLKKSSLMLIDNLVSTRRQWLMTIN